MMTLAESGYWVDHWWFPIAGAFVVALLFVVFWPLLEKWGDHIHSK